MPFYLDQYSVSKILCLTQYLSNCSIRGFGLQRDLFWGDSGDVGLEGCRSSLWRSNEATDGWIVRNKSAC